MAEGLCSQLGARYRELKEVLGKLNRLLLGVKQQSR